MGSYHETTARQYNENAALKRIGIGTLLTVMAVIEVLAYTPKSYQSVAYTITQHPGGDLSVPGRDTDAGEHRHAHPDAHAHRHCHHGRDGRHRGGRPFVLPTVVPSGGAAYDLSIMDVKNTYPAIVRITVN